MRVWNIESPEAMHALGKELSQMCRVLLLHGDLGAGKTTLIKGFADGLGINPDQVQSPTYTYLNSYDDRLLHIDMYRFEHINEVIEKGILSQIAEFDYVVIEWPKWIEQLDLGAYSVLEISKLSASERVVRLLD